MAPKVILLSMAIAGQLGVLATEYLGSVYPLWVGQEVKLEVVPVDPRSLFRGNYARLNYPIDRVDGTEVIGQVGLIRNGERIYVPLIPSGDLYVAGKATLFRPETGVFIRGRVQDSYGDRLDVDYGIDAYFAPKEKAQKLEGDLRSGGIATVRIAPNGKAALVDVAGKAERN